METNSIQFTSEQIHDPSPFMLAEKRSGMLYLFIFRATQTACAITSYACALPSFSRGIRARCLEQ